MYYVQTFHEQQTAIILGRETNKPSMLREFRKEEEPEIP
jgi:hypothetical protein